MFFDLQIAIEFLFTGQWNNLPLIPLADEMMGTPLESDSHLSEVKVNQPYCTSEQYMDTYFRLLRTECFSGMQSGIKDLLSGTLGGHSITTWTRQKEGRRGVNRK